MRLQGTEIRDKIIAILPEPLSSHAKLLDRDFSFFSDEYLSSIDLLNLVISIEDLVGFSLNDDQMELLNFDNIYSIENMVVKLLSEKKSH